MLCAVETGSAPDDLSPGLRALFPPSAMKLLQVELALEPTELATSYPGPVFVLQGERDIKVLAENAGRLRAAFSQRDIGRCEVFVVPAASHNFKPVENETDPGFEGDVVPAALDELSAWVEREL